VAGRVLILSASMGAGHDGAARELARRLRAKGWRAEVVDFLACLPLGLGRFLRLVYRLQLRYAPWTYETSYRLCDLVPALRRLVAAAIALAGGPSLRRLVRRAEPDLVVSTYPFASLVLGRGRQRGWLPVPVATFVTDFAAHGLWLHEGVDLHLCVHEQTERAIGLPARTTGPVVPDRFAPGRLDRAEARRRLGLPGDRRLALVVAGAWGVGALAETVEAVLATGSYLPVVVCGTNDRLRRRLEKRHPQAVVLGWTDEMPTLMAACDVLVQNAGGLSCMEAFAAHLPVVTYRPVAGHGRANAKAMERAGVAPVVHGRTALRQALDEALGEPGAERVAAAASMFRADAVGPLEALASARPLPRVPVPEPLRPTPLRRRFATLAASLAVAYLGLNLGANWASSLGLDLARSTHAPPADVAYLAVRLGPGGLADPATAPLLAARGVSAVVDGSLAIADPAWVRRLAQAGVDVADGGWAPEDDLHLVLVSANALRSIDAIRLATGRPCRVLVPAGTVNSVDLASAILEHVRIVRDATPLGGSRPFPAALAPGRIYVLDALHLSGPATDTEVRALSGEARAEGLRLLPLSALR
jgi:processive 1,2-diacylglycerol beta-glucosyltransferase